MFGMVKPPTVHQQDVEGNRGRVRFESGGPDRQQQAVDQHADHTRGREHRPCRGYR